MKSRRSSRSAPKKLALTLCVATVAMSEVGVAMAAALEEVVVTAQRRSQNLQDVPIAVTSLSKEQLDVFQIDDTLDVARTVPNMVAANTVGLGTSVLYFLRGVGSTESIATFDLPVGTYIDEVYISRQNANQIMLSSVERVEVLRGPQGTLFGRNTTGGAVQIITEKPGEEFDGDVEVGVGRFDRISGRGSVNIPISDALAMRFSAFVVEDDGWLDNQSNSDTFNAEESWGARVAVRYAPSDTLQWNVSTQYVEAEKLMLGSAGIVDPATFQASSVPATGDLFETRIDDRNCKASGSVDTWANQGCQFNEADSSLTISNLQLDFDAGTLNFITGYYEVDQDFNIDFLGNSDQPIFGGAFGANFYISNQGRSEQFSQEIKWQSSAFNDKLTYVAGIYYMNEDNATRFTDTINFPIAPGIALPLILANRDPLANETENIAVYAQGDYSLTDLLTLQLGLRYTKEEKTIDLSGESLDFATLSMVPLTSAEMSAAGIPLEQIAEELTPRIGLYYQLSDTIMSYISYTEGFKSGGWNARGTNALELQPFGPEFVDSYEAGLRSDWLDGQLRVNATAFRAEYSDFQVPSVFPGSSTFLTLNSGDARVNGLELEMVYAVVNNTNVFANVGLMDSEYDNLSSAALAAGIGPELQRAPDASAQIGFASSFSLGASGSLGISADAKYTSDFETDPSNAPQGSIDALTLVNAQVRWDSPDESLALILECANCLDKEWHAQNLFGMVYPAAPMTWNMRVKYAF
jgi:iron complex outermembrane receptor protein